MKTFFIKIHYFGAPEAVDIARFRVPNDTNSDDVKKVVADAVAICKKEPLECSVLLEMMQSIAEQFNGTFEIIPFVGDLMAS